MKNRKYDIRLFAESLLCLLAIVVLTIFELCLTQSIYSDDHLLENIQETSINLQARIDIHNTNGARIEVQEAKELDITYPIGDWCLKQNGDNCASIKMTPTKEWSKFLISFTVLNSGKTKIKLMGPYQENEGIVRPILVDYKDFKINGKSYIPNGKTVWHNKSFSKEFAVKKGEKVQFSISIRRPPFRWRYLTEFYSFNIIRFLYTLLFCVVLASFIIYIRYKYSYPACFIVIIFILLALPMMNLSDEMVSNQENRTLAKFPEMRKEGKINSNYGKEFESWLGDRFWGRNKLIHFHEKIQFINRVVRNKKAFYLKQEGWMFRSTEKIPDISKKKISESIRRIKNFGKFCTDHGIKLYILVVPQKNIIYTEKFDEYFYVSPKAIDSYVNVITEIKNQLGSVLVFPYKELKDGAKKDFVFFKESHHWTDYGAFLGYMKLMNSIKQDFKNVKIVSLNDYKKTLNKKIRDDWDRAFNTGHTTNVLNILPKYAEEHILKTNYTYYDPPVEIKAQILDIPGYKVKTFKNPDPKVKYKVFLSGFSDNENLLQFLPYSFAELKYYRLNNVQDVRSGERELFLKRYKKDLLDYKPDILILTVKSTHLFSEKFWGVED